MKKITVAVAIAMTVVLSGCAALSQFGQELTQAWKGVPATMTTYTEDGVLIDRIDGTSFRVSRDDRFDTTDSEGISKNDSSVLMISLGDSHVSHVGAAMMLEQQGLENIMAETNSRVSIENTEAGVPWLNDFVEQHRNLWAGKSKTVMIRSQDGTPIGVYTGNNVEIVATEVPKSTWFRIDGKMLFVYRVTYTVVDTDLLEGKK